MSRTQRPLRALRNGSAAALLLWIAGCASTSDGMRHVVRPGENLYRISLHYDVAVDDIAKASRLRNKNQLAVGQELVIPGVDRQQPSRPLASSSAPSRPRVERKPAVQGDRDLARREAKVELAWPLSGRINSRFGWRSGRRHEGIDIKASKGTPVQAAEAGRVIYSGKLADYGRVVIIKHAGRYSTVYAHNNRNKAKKGQFVEKGDLIATVGKSGNATGAHLHFEVRRDRVAQDPLRYLPDATATAAARSSSSIR